MIQTYFYNSLNGDRVYNASSMEEWLRKFFTSGVFAGDYQVTLTGAMTISVGAGYANINGKVAYSDADVELAISTADSSQTRVDSVVLERDDINRVSTLKIVNGTPGGAAHVPVRSNGIYQLVLAQITVEPGDVVITSGKVLDTRSDTDLCGYVVQAVQDFDFGVFRAQFDEWLEGIREYLDAVSPTAAMADDLAALKVRVTALDGGTASSTTVTEIANKLDTIQSGATHSFKQVIWTNSNPSANFSGQTVTLSQDIYSFDFILFELYYRKSSQYLQTLLVSADYTGDIALRVVTMGSVSAGRNASMSGSTVTIGDGTYNGSTTSGNEYCIPYRIIGICL